MIHVTQFAGIKPAVSSWLLPPQHATVAHNARLRDGTLQPYDAPVVGGTIVSGTIRGLYLPNDGDFGRKASILKFTYPVCVTESPGPGAGSPWDLLVVWPLNNTAPFRQNRWDSTKTYPLIVPAPVDRPTITPGSVPPEASADPDERIYCYTWVDQFGVESPPSPPSVPVVMYDGQSANLTALTTPPAHVVYIRFYRTSSKMELGDKDAPFDTSFQLVEEVATPAANYVDNRRLRDIDFGTLQTEDNQPPPEMDGVVLTHDGYYVGFDAGQLYVSERHEPHNWPEKYRVELPEEIVGIATQTHVAARYGHILTHDLVYIMTTGRPYRMTVAWKQGPNETSDANIQPVPFDEAYRCLDKHTIAPTNDGVMYVSDKGIVELKFQGPAILHTRRNFDEDYFMQYAPNMAVWLNGRYIATSNPSGRGLILDDRTGPEGGKDLGDLVTIDLNALVLHAGHDGRLYYASGNTYYTWNESPHTRMTYRWRSKVFRQPQLVAPGAAKVTGDYGPPITFRLYQGPRLVYERQVTSSEPFRLPCVGKFVEWQFEVEGSNVVREVHLAVTMAELADLRTGSQRDKQGEAA